ncbi:MAG TPA: ferrous iron transporter B [Thermoanaerobaculia bacterium]|jgi:ferrous iron transport protein B
MSASPSSCHGCPVAALPVRRPARLVGLVGPPNSGKSTLFNRLTGLRQKVANYPGVTVEERRGRARLDGETEVVLIDLPGVYSLTPRSEDERVTRDVLAGEMAGQQKPDAILLILDSTNLKRHLVLAAPVLALGLPTLVVLNMADELEARGGSLDPAALAEQLGTPVALVSAAKGEGIETVYEFLKGAIGVPRALDLPALADIPKCRQWAVRVGDGAGYAAPAPPIWTRRLDAVFLHPVAGPLIFLAVVIAVFQTIFSAARPLMDAVDHAVSASGSWLSGVLPASALKSLLIEGVWSGVGSVIVFLPQILLLFLFIGLLEDSGYLARAALIADRTMRKAGLQGKSFLPLLSAYACAVPAVLAARTIENKRDRIATILIAPFMTCSARLPVYTLIIAAFIPERPILGLFLGTRAAAMLGLYLLGFLAAFGTARLLKSSVLKSDGAPFLLEMPPYRRPTLRQIVLRMYDRAKIFLRRAGTVILGVAVVLWILAHLPLSGGKMPEIANSVAGTIGRLIEPLVRPLGFDWRIGIGIVMSLAAREVIVGTLGTLYGMDPKAGSVGLQAALRHDLTPGGAVALLVFFAFAMQCLSTVAVVRRETGGWKWPAVQFAYMGLLAYSGAFIANRLVTLFLG